MKYRYKNTKRKLIKEWGNKLRQKHKTWLNEIEGAIAERDLEMLLVKEKEQEKVKRNKMNHNISFPFHVSPLFMDHFGYSSGSLFLNPCMTCYANPYFHHHGGGKQEEKRGGDGTTAIRETVMIAPVLFAQRSFCSLHLFLPSLLPVVPTKGHMYISEHTTKLFFGTYSLAHLSQSPRFVLRINW